jgi:hypothetical protein
MPKGNLPSSMIKRMTPAEKMSNKAGSYSFLE